MALFKPFRGVRTELPTEMHDGYAYFCTDDGTFHIDYVDENGVLQRKQVCGGDISGGGDADALITAHNIDTSAHNDIRTSINNLNTRVDNHEEIIDNSVMIDKSFGNGPDTIAEGNHTHGDLQLQIQSIEEVINADYYDTSESVDFFTEITPSHTVWAATSSSKVTDVDIIGGRYVCTTSTVDHGLKTENLTDLIDVVKGKTLIASANLSSDNYTLYIKMNDGTAWSFGKIKSTDKIVTFDVPENLTQFKFGLEYKGDGSAPETCEVTNFAIYLVNDATITSTANIPNRNYTIWSWNTEELLNPEPFAAFCKSYKINRIYQHISTSMLDLETIRNFVGTMQKNRVSVNWLTGDPSWTLADHHYHIVDQFQKIITYNMSIQNDYEKIGTIQFDLEPYTLAEWDTDQASVIKQYQDAIVLMYNESIAKQLSLNVCVASWFDGITYDNEYGQGNLFDFVSKHSSSTVIMAYNTRSYVSIAEDEIRMGAANGKNVAVGLETHVVDDSVTEDITFANKPIEDLYRAFETLFLVYKMYGVYKGYEFVIHDYAYFKAYAESFNLTVESNDILDKLNTENKTDLISAINEINTEVGSIKTSVTDGKAMIASAITSKGVQTASDATFETMANNIAAINAGSGTEEDKPTENEVTYDLTLEIGKLSRTDGSERDEGDGLRMTDFISTPEGATIMPVYSHTDQVAACFLGYDENYNLITNWPKDSTGVNYKYISSGETFEVPSGTSYVRAYWSTTDTSGTAQLTVSTVSEEISVSANDFSLEYGLLSLASGKPIPSTVGVRTVNYIKCYGNALCYFSTGDHHFVVLFFDEDFNLIHGWTWEGKSYDYAENEYIVAPKNTAYVRLFCDSDGVDISNPLSMTLSKIDDIYTNLSNEAEAATATALAGRTAESFVFAAFSDMHLRDCEINKTVIDWTAYGLSEIQKRMQLDMVAFLGDFVDGSSTDSVDEGKAELKECRKIFYNAIGSTPSLWVAGNHDNNHYNGTELTGDELYSYLGANNINVVTHYGNKQRIYGYRDFEEDKVRAIYLNTSDCSSSDTTSSSHMSALQIKWLAEVALDFSEKSDANEWGIIVLSHMPLNWSSSTQLALNVLDAYILGLSTSVTADDEVIPIDYSSITNKAEIIAYFNGHTHNYRYRQIGMANTWGITIPQVCINRCNHYATDDPEFAEFDAEGNPVYYYKTIGTNETTSFSLITIDRINKKITIAKYGAGYNRECIYGNSADSDLSYQSISFVNSREGRSTYVFAYDSNKNLISDYFSGSAYTKVGPNGSYTFNSNAKYIRCFADTSNTSGTFTLTYESGDSISYTGTTGSLNLTTGLNVDEGRDFRSDFIELTF